MSGSQSSFVSTYLPYAQNVSQQTGLPTDYILAQAAEESGWGSSNAAVNGNNFFGISPGGSLASYGSAAEGFQAFANLLSSPRYTAISGAASNGSLAIGQALVSAGYNTADSSYASNIASIVPTIDSILQQQGQGSLATGGSSSGSNSTGQSATGSSNSTLLHWLGVSAATVALAAVGIVFIIGGIYLLGRQPASA